MPSGSLESTRRRAARRPGPFLRASLSPRVGIGHPVLLFDVRRLCLWNTRTRTRVVPGFTVSSPRSHISLWRCDQLSRLCRRSLELPRVKGNIAQPRLRRGTSWCSRSALKVSSTRGLNDHHFHRSDHDSAHTHRAIQHPCMDTQTRCAPWGAYSADVGFTHLRLRQMKAEMRGFPTSYLRAPSDAVGYECD